MMERARWTDPLRANSVFVRMQLLMVWLRVLGKVTRAASTHKLAVMRECKHY